MLRTNGNTGETQFDSRVDWKQGDFPLGTCPRCGQSGHESELPLSRSCLSFLSKDGTLTGSLFEENESCSTSEGHSHIIYTVKIVNSVPKLQQLSILEANVSFSKWIQVLETTFAQKKYGQNWGIRLFGFTKMKWQMDKLYLP